MGTGPISKGDDDSMDLLNRLTAYRAQEEKLRWEGTFLDYLNIVRQHPKVAQSAHSRIYNMIEAAGITTDDDGRKHYKFFENEIFGLEGSIERLVEEYFHSAARRLDGVGSYSCR